MSLNLPAECHYPSGGSRKRRPIQQALVEHLETWNHTHHQSSNYPQCQNPYGQWIGHRTPDFPGQTHPIMQVGCHTLQGITEGTGALTGPDPLHRHPVKYPRETCHGVGQSMPGSNHVQHALPYTAKGSF
ncbi:MAG: hypothetical protein BWY82_00790 [Verrucomicrobia bacterium ADurb.Bin474]|nr:MAG: hypothetical protein BWY82_00790 [Verrucomicrobia bacterium ADurb.Bin474]